MQRFQVAEGGVVCGGGRAWQGEESRGAHAKPRDHVFLFWAAAKALSHLLFTNLEPNNGFPKGPDFRRLAGTVLIL